MPFAAVVKPSLDKHK